MFRLTREEGTAVQAAGLEPWAVEDAANEADFLSLEEFIEDIGKTLKGKIDFAIRYNLEAIKEELLYWMEKKYMGVIV